MLCFVCFVCMYVCMHIYIYVLYDLFFYQATDLTGSSCYTIGIGSQALCGDGRSQEGLEPYGGAKFVGGHSVGMGWAVPRWGQVET